MRKRITIHPYSVRCMGEGCTGTNRHDSRFTLPKTAPKVASMDGGRTPC
ncbi:MAG: hypothetical protein ACUVQ6_02380 [Dissulfurimicrobium sp.]